MCTDVSEFMQLLPSVIERRTTGRAFLSRYAEICVTPAAQQKSISNDWKKKAGSSQ